MSGNDLSDRINHGFVSDDVSKGSDNNKTYGNIATKKSVESVEVSDDYDPYEHRKVEHPLTNLETMIHLLKIALGTGIFAMPNAFSHAGFLVGLIGTIIIGSIATYCAHMLINTHYLLCKRNKVASMSYPLIAEAAVLAGPPQIHSLAPYMIHVVNVFILMYGIGASCVYVLFISSNLKDLADYFFETKTDIRLFMLMLLLPLILINWVRNLKYLAPLSTIGSFVTMASFGVICFYIFREPLTFEGKHAIGQISEIPTFFSTVLFALEAIGIIVPLENEMRSPKSFAGATGVLNKAMCIIVALYIGLGFFGYMRYGDTIRSSITLNLPDQDLPAQILKAMISCGVFVSHALACYVAVDLAWKEYILKRLTHSTHKLFWEYVLRTAIVFLTFILAVAIPNLEQFISLFGALTLSILGLALPAFLECCARWCTTHGWSRATLLLKNVIIGLISLASLLIGTTLSIKEIIGKYYE